MRHLDDLRQVVEEEDIVVGVLAVPTAAAQPLADKLVDAGVKIIFNYSEALLQVPPEVTVHTSSPAVDLLYALYFYLTLIDTAAARATFEASDGLHRGHRGGVRTPGPRDAGLVPGFERAARRRPQGRRAGRLDRRRADLQEIEIRSGRGTTSRTPSPARWRRAGGCPRWPRRTASCSARPARTRCPITAPST